MFDNKEAMHGAVDQWINEHILPKSASSLKLANRAARHGFNESLFARLDQLERLYLDELMATHDANEGITSFLERRAPIWKNK